MYLKDKPEISPELRRILNWSIIFAIVSVGITITSGQHWVLGVLAWVIGGSIGGAFGGYLNARRQ